MSLAGGLEALSDAFHGVVPEGADWMTLIEAANRALVTPNLHAALERSGAAGAIPEDAAAFFALVGSRNDERNARLRAMALDAVTALNAAGVVPIYLKGMAVWAACGAEGRFARMMSDADLLVRPEEADRAVDALSAAGFRLMERSPPGLHVIAEFWREGDVGALDLHARPPGPRKMLEAFDPDADTIPAAWPGAARIPAPAHQIYLTCLHDLFHEAGFWRGGFDLRHLCDIADLARGPRGVDWDALRAAAPTRLTRNAVCSQLIAAQRIVGAAAPPDLATALIPGLHHRRHVAQQRVPAARIPLALAGMALEAFNLRPHWPALDGEAATFAEFIWRLRHEPASPTRI